MARPPNYDHEKRRKDQERVARREASREEKRLRRANRDAALEKAKLQGEVTPEIAADQAPHER